MSLTKRICSFTAALSHDLISDALATEGHILWINGLAKSGTSLIEDIAYKLGFVDGARSLLRSRLRLKSLDNAVFDPKLFEFQPGNKKTYLKTHCVYQEGAIEWDCAPKVSTVIVCRDIRDALVSRYFHICSDPRHWDFARLMSLPDHERFKASVLATNPTYNMSQLEYYIYWVNSWVKSSWGADIFWYEDYLANPVNFIERLVLTCGVTKVDLGTVESYLDSRRKSVSGLSDNLAARRAGSGGRSATFRSGTAGQYKKFFDPELDELFDSLMTDYELEGVYAKN